jgi:group I intron endonuclease
MKTNYGIYRIINIINNKIYIGSSSNLKSRKYKHFNSLLRDSHYNKHLQSAYNKYGKENFKWEIIEYVQIIENKEEFKKLLLEREQYYLDLYESYNSNIGYNMSISASSRLGVKLSEETIRKRTESRKYYKPSEETRRKLSKSLKGKRLSEETKEKIRKAHTGENNYQYGKPLPEETKKKISESLKGRGKGKKLSEETKKKISDALTGKKLSKESILKRTLKQSKKVFNLDTGETFLNSIMAGRYYNIYPENIRRVCNGHRNKAGGFRWKYLEN